ncbi:MAG: bacteriohemerythrin [Treponema sp.]|jgi:hemerythrin|nr:bacteriohemerythrin [Treponema sp.]
MAGSEIIHWSPTFSVGVKLIDDQHRELLDLTNDLFNHCVGDEKSERAYFESVIGKAVQYIRGHFSTEEKIMIATNYPGYKDHKRAHDTFVLQVIEQARSFEEKRSFTLLAFTRYLKDWILTHIAVVDKEYVEYFKKIATRKADGRLTITRSDIR